MTELRVENKTSIPGSRTVTDMRPLLVPSFPTGMRDDLPALMSLIPVSHSPYYGYDNFISIREEEPFLTHIPDNFRVIDQNGGKTR